MNELDNKESSASQDIIAHALLCSAFWNRNDSLSQNHMASKSKDEANNHNKGHEDQISVVVDNR